MPDIVEAGQTAECAICELPIEKGDDIVLMDGWWTHAECVGTFVGLAVTRQIVVQPTFAVYEDGDRYGH